MTPGKTRWWILALSGLVIAGALWVLSRGGDPPAAGNAGTALGNAPAPPLVARTPEPEAPGPAAPAALPPTIDGKPELAAYLTSRGLDAERIINGYQAWRVARGFFDESALTGVTRDSSTSQVYARMDDVSLEQMAQAGEMAALQEQGARLELVDSIGSLEKYMAAAQMGSSAAMFGASRALAGVAALQAEDTSGDPELTATLQTWRNMDGSTDIRQEALAWALAAVRTDGAAVVDSARLAQMESMARGLSDDQLRMACAESLAYFGGFRGKDGGSGLRRGVPPPVFVATPGVYERLPCGDTAAPITPPRPMERCQAFPARDEGNQPIDVWICPEN